MSAMTVVMTTMVGVQRRTKFLHGLRNQAAGKMRNAECGKSATGILWNDDAE